MLVTTTKFHAEGNTFASGKNRFRSLISIGRGAQNNIPKKGKCFK
jgi:hypothetical protein